MENKTDKIKAMETIITYTRGATTEIGKSLYRRAEAILAESKRRD